MANRRDFIKVSALGLGGIAMSASAINILKAAVPQDLVDSDSDPQKGLKRFPTYCEVCFWKCAGWTHTDEDGKIIKIIGHEADPHCNGRLCPRGTGGIGMYYDKDRLTTPLIREGEPGSQTFRQASWDEALDLIAKKMREIGNKYGPEAMALFNHGSSGHYFGHLMKAFGSTNIVAPSYAQCRGPREVGFTATFGAGIG